MDLHLHKVSASGRINLGDLLAGVELAQATKNADGTVTVSPVNIVPAGRVPASTVQDVPLPGLDEDGDHTDGEGPWDADGTDD